VKSLLLDTTTWDLCLDANRNIAIAADPYALAQDVSCAIRTFLAEVWYDETQGIPYFQTIFGKTPPIAVFQQLMVNATLNCRPTTADLYVKSAQCVLQSFNAANRVVIGQVQFVDSNGNPGSVAIGQ
jgi:hypothetical protein